MLQMYDDHLIHVCATAGNLCLLAAVWWKGTLGVRWVQTINCLVILAQNLEPADHALLAEWQVYDLAYLLLWLAMAKALDGRRTAFVCFVTPVVMLAEYIIAAPAFWGDYQLSIRIYYPRMWIDIFCTTFLAVYLLTRARLQASATPTGEANARTRQETPQAA